MQVSKAYSTQLTDMRMCMCMHTKICIHINFIQTGIAIVFNYFLGIMIRVDRNISNDIKSDFVWAAEGHREKPLSVCPENI